MEARCLESNVLVPVASTFWTLIIGRSRYGYCTVPKLPRFWFSVQRRNFIRCGRWAKRRNVGHEDVLLAILSLPNVHPGCWVSNRNKSRGTVKTTLFSYKEWMTNFGGYFILHISIYYMHNIYTKYLYSTIRWHLHCHSWTAEMSDWIQTWNYLHVLLQGSTIHLSHLSNEVAIRMTIGPNRRASPFFHVFSDVPWYIRTKIKSRNMLVDRRFFGLPGQNADIQGPFFYCSCK